jgi:hypothetical protein
MASISTSVIDSNSLQADGRRWIVELHTDQAGVRHYRTYLAEVGTDINAALANYVTILLAQLSADEIAANLLKVTTLGSLASVSLVYSTAAANASALRTAYATATQTQSAMIGDYLNTLTSQQLQTAFGLTSGQVTTLRTNKLTPAATLASSIRASTGQ